MGNTPRSRQELLTRAVAVLASSDLDRFLTRYASRYGAGEAVAAAQAIGANPQGWLDQRAQRQSSVRQNSNTFSTGPSFDPDNDDPETLKLLQSGAPMDRVNEARRAAIAAHEKAGGNKSIGPPGSYPDEKVQAPRQRSQPLTADRSAS